MYQRQEFYEKMKHNWAKVSPVTSLYYKNVCSLKNINTSEKMKNERFVENYYLEQPMAGAPTGAFPRVYMLMVQVERALG